MKDNRPVNLDIGTVDLPITAYASITHRISGLFLVVGMALLLWLLDMSLESPESFAATKAILQSFWCKLLLLLVLAGLSYHTVAGIRHLFMDMGYGETLEGGTATSKFVFLATAALVVLSGLWLW